MEWNLNAAAIATVDEGREKDVASYQIECQTTKKGKMIAGTKRRICWKFGFFNRDAIRRGLSGIDCRGEEHEVVFVWSLTSGKKFVLADGHEVHWSKKSPFSERFDGSWQCSWQSQMAGVKRELAVVAHPSSSLFEKRKNKNSRVANSRVTHSSFRNFDLLIDGVSFSEMPQMFELGLTKTVKDRRRMQMGGLDAQRETDSHQQQSPSQRRKQIHDYDNDVSSHHSYSSQQQQPQRKHINDNNNDAVSRNSFSTSDLLYFREHPHQQQQHQHVPLVACNELMSQSMPDMRHDFLTSPTSVLGGGESVPHLNYHLSGHQHQLQQQSQFSPTSVSDMTASNPFDLYAPATIKQQEQPQQIHAQFNNNNYVPHPQQHQHQQSIVY